jgi:hypothetical protein
MPAPRDSDKQKTPPIAGPSRTPRAGLEPATLRLTAHPRTKSDGEPVAGSEAEILDADWGVGSQAVSVMDLSEVDQRDTKSGCWGHAGVTASSIKVLWSRLATFGSGRGFGSRGGSRMGPLGGCPSALPTTTRRDPRRIAAHLPRVAPIVGFGFTAGGRRPRRSPHPESPPGQIHVRRLRLVAAADLDGSFKRAGVQAERL